MLLTRRGEGCTWVMAAWEMALGTTLTTCGEATTAGPQIPGATRPGATRPGAISPGAGAGTGAGAGAAAARLRRATKTHYKSTSF